MRLHQWIYFQVCNWTWTFFKISLLTLNYSKFTNKLQNGLICNCVNCTNVIHMCFRDYSRFCDNHFVHFIVTGFRILLHSISLTCTRNVNVVCCVLCQTCDERLNTSTISNEQTLFVHIFDGTWSNMETVERVNAQTQCKASNLNVFAHLNVNMYVDETAPHSHDATYIVDTKWLCAS